MNQNSMELFPEAINSRRKWNHIFTFFRENDFQQRVLNSAKLSNASGASNKYLSKYARNKIISPSLNPFIKSY